MVKAYTDFYFWSHAVLFKKMSCLNQKWFPALCCNAPASARELTLSILGLIFPHLPIIIHSGKFINVEVASTLFKMDN